MSMSNKTNKTIDQRIDSLEKQIRHLFNLTRATIDNQVRINTVINGPTDIQLTHAHEWRKKREENKPPRVTMYDAQYYRPNDLDTILAEYLISQIP